MALSKSGTYISPRHYRILVGGVQLITFFIGLKAYYAFLFSTHVASLEPKTRSVPDDLIIETYFRLRCFPGYSRLLRGSFQDHLIGHGSILHEECENNAVELTTSDVNSRYHVWNHTCYIRNNLHRLLLYFELYLFNTSIHYLKYFKIYYGNFIISSLNSNRIELLRFICWNLFGWVLPYTKILRYLL